MRVGAGGRITISENHGPAADPGRPASLPDIRVPGGPTLLGLLLGLALGLLLNTGGMLAPWREPAIALAGPIGALWLQALKMTILPLVAGLLFVGIDATVAAASAGAMARRTLALIVGILATSALVGAVVMPVLLALAGPTPDLSAMLAPGSPMPRQAPGLADFLAGLLPGNVVNAAAQDALLPVILFVALFALATTRLAEPNRRALVTLFEGLAGAMMVLIGWVLRAAPVAVFALGLGLTGTSGGHAIGTLTRYVILVAACGGVLLALAYPLAVFAGQRGLRAFARAVLPAQVVAVSTQSSLAALPAMLAACRGLDVRATSGEFVLPLAVTLFRATSPAMNLAVCVYAAHMAGVSLSPTALAAGALVAFLTTFGSVSLPGTVSFIASTAPIVAAMGVPLWPLGVLVAVEMLPDMMRTLGNVTMDVAVTATVDAGNPVTPQSILKSGGIT